MMIQQSSDKLYMTMTMIKDRDDGLITQSYNSTAEFFRKTNIVVINIPERVTQQLFKYVPVHQ